MVDLHEFFKYRFHPVQPTVDHDNCTHFTRRCLNPNILPGTQATRLHIKTGKIRPPPDLLAIDAGSFLFTTKILGASLFIFRLGIFLTCHLHMPHGLSESPYRTLWRDRILYITMSELRKLRIPTDIQISIDGDPYSPLTKQEVEAYSNIMHDTLNRLPPFMDPHDKCNMYVRPVDEETVDFFKKEYCKCCLCTTYPCSSCQHTTHWHRKAPENKETTHQIWRLDHLKNKRKFHNCIYVYYNIQQIHHITIQFSHSLFIFIFAFMYLNFTF